jgi:hypothetical protein
MELKKKMIFEKETIERIRKKLKKEHCQLSEEEFEARFRGALNTFKKDCKDKIADTFSEHKFKHYGGKRFAKF